MTRSARKRAPTKPHKRPGYGPVEWFMAAVGLGVLALVVAIVVGALVG